MIFYMLPLNLAVSSIPDLLPRNIYRLIFATENRLFQEAKTGPGGGGVEGGLAEILP